MKEHEESRISGSCESGGSEIPLSSMFFYLRGWVRSYANSLLELSPTLWDDACHGQRQVGSLAGAAHLLKNNAGVQRGAQWRQKRHVDQKGKSLLDFDFQYE